MRRFPILSVFVFLCLLACESRWLTYESRPISDIANPDTVLLANTPPLPEAAEEIGLVTMQQDSIKGILLACDQNALVMLSSRDSFDRNNAVARYFPFNNIKQIERLSSRKYMPVLYVVSLGIAGGLFAIVAKAPPGGQLSGWWTSRDAVYWGVISAAAGGAFLYISSYIASRFSPHEFTIKGDREKYLRAQKHLKEFAVSGDRLPPEVYRKVYGLENK